MCTKVLNIYIFLCLDKPVKKGKRGKKSVSIRVNSQLCFVLTFIINIIMLKIKSSFKCKNVFI